VKFGVNLDNNGIKGKIVKHKTGKSKAKYIVHIEYFDEAQGKTRFMELHATGKRLASDLLEQLKQDIKNRRDKFRRAKE
jgi:hypothetical protein